MKIKLNEITNNDMKHNRIILENGLIINYNDRFIGDIIVENGMIVKVIKKANTEISKKSMRDNENSETNSFYNNSSQEIRIDCKGKYILPGIVDPHSHLRDMEQSYKETIETATQAALSNGITTILAMPNTIPPLSSIDTISNYMDLIKRKARNNVGIIAALRPPLCLGDFNELKRNNIYGIKVYPGAKSSSINLEWVPLIDAYHTLSKKYNDPFFSIDLLGGFRNFFGKILKDIREPVKGSISGPDQNNAGNNENNGDLIRFYRIINKYIDGPGASEFLKLLNKSASRVSRLYDDLKEILVQDNNYSYHNWSELFDRSRKYNIPLLFHPDVPLEKKELETRFNNFLSQNNNRSNKYLVAHSMTYSDLAEILHILYIGILLEEYFGNNARRVSSDAPLNTHPDNNSNISTGIPLNSPPKNKSDSENKLIIKFCHVSAHMSLLAIKLLEKLRLSDDIRFDIEVTPHHLFLNYNIEERLRKQNIPITHAKVLCPLRDPVENVLLLKFLNDGKISYIGTDHAPHSIQEKAGSFFNAPSGFPEFDSYVPYFMSMIFKYDLLSLEDFVKFASYMPSRLFNIPNIGVIKESFVSDLIVCEKSKNYTKNFEDLLSKSKLSPYNLKELSSKINYIILGNRFFKIKYIN